MRKGGIVSDRRRYESVALDVTAPLRQQYDAAPSVNDV